MKNRLLATTALTAAVLLTAPQTASAMPPAAAPILVSAMASGIGAGVVAGTMAAAFQAFAISAAMGFVSTALAPKPKKPRVTEGGFVSNNLGSALDHAIVYGQTKVGGVVFYASTSNNETILHRMIAVAGHEIDSYISFYLNDEEITIGGNGVCTAPSKFADKVYIQTKLGTDDQTAVDLFGFYDGEDEFGNPILAQVEPDEGTDTWTDQHRARGIAYIYVAFKFDQDAFPNGAPTVTAIIKGRKVYHPVTETTAWSDNAALCVRDYLTADFGLACDSDEIDDVSFADAIIDCDDDVGLINNSGTEKRYTVNGSFTTASTPNDVITQLLTAYAGMIWYSQGKFGTRAGTWDSPALSYNEDDLIGSIEITTRLSRRDQVNQVNGVFRGPLSNYQQTDYPPIKSSTFLSEDNNQVSILDLALPFTDTPSRAQRIAKIALYRQREQLRVNIKTGLSGFKAKVGDVIQLTNTRMGWTNKTFEVTDWSFALSDDMAFEVNMQLAEISSDVFSWTSDEQTFIQNNTTLPSPYSVPSVILDISSDLRKTKQSVISILIADVSSSTPTRVSSVELQFRLTPPVGQDTAWTTASTGPLGRLEIINLVEGENYDFRARGMSPLGLFGPYKYEYNYAFDPAKLIPPSDVTGFDRTFSRSNLILFWNPISDLDAFYYQIKYSSQTSGASFNDATVIAQKIAHPTSTFSYSARSGTYFIAAYDRSGNSCNNHASLVVQPSDLPSLDTTDTLTENTTVPIFDGNRTNMEVNDDDELLMTSFASAGSTGTYEFSNYLETSDQSIKTAYVDVVYTQTRHHANAVAGEVNWDDISSSYTFDQFLSTFDNFTDENLPWNDTNIEFYVRYTSDDPSTSPTWSNWAIVSGGIITGRAFEFKLVCSNTSTNVTPAFSAIEAQVSY